ncbi:MAG: hypothetical protein H6738_21960 [Alphaproteobacteria bacterium]|nr:hypothetical protein [Alphaproteobacteria bacterium]MCB9699464.1 hypothetical protein [Alphaproteobacteria bacterium]
MWFVWSALAWAGSVDTWVGGRASTGVGVDSVSGVSTVLSQVELDATAAGDVWSARLDLDYHFVPVSLSHPDTNGPFEPIPAYPLPPEEASLTLGGGAPQLTLGVTNPNLGLQEWDEGDNYLATYTRAWDFSNSQNLGLQPSWNFDSGLQLFAFGGWDMGWYTPGFGLGWAYEGDSYGTWSGGFYLPAYEHGMFYWANEFYPADALWIAVEPNIGVSGGGLVVGTEAVLNVFPEGVVAGALRVEAQYTTDTAAEWQLTELETAPMDPLRVTVGGRTDPTDWLHLALDLGTVAAPYGGGDPSFLGVFLVDIHAPFPEE